MHSAFTYPRYLLQKQFFALTGVFRLMDPNGNLVLFSKQKMFKLREDIRAYSDESMTQELLVIKARSIIDFSAAYDVIDATSGMKVGVWRRKGFRSMIQDRWELLDAGDAPIGYMEEDSLGYALLRRFLLGRLLPQNYDLFVGDTRSADLKQRFDLFRYHLDLDFTVDPSSRIDKRMGIAAAILLGTIEGKQES